MTNKQNADASESFRQLMAAYSKAFSSTPDSVKEEENADDTATTTENGTTPSPRTASILDADDETTETALEFNLERAKLLNRQKEQELEEQAQKIKRLKARNARRWLSIILRGILAVTAIVFVGILWVIARNLFPFHDKHRDREAEKTKPKTNPTGKRHHDIHRQSIGGQRQLITNRPGARKSDRGDSVYTAVESNQAASRRPNEQRGWRHDARRAPS